MLLDVKHPRTIFRFAMAGLALFGALGLVHPASTFSEGVVDGIRGALLAVTIGLIYVMFRLERKRGGDLS